MIESSHIDQREVTKGCTGKIKTASLYNIKQLMFGLLDVNITRKCFLQMFSTWRQNVFANFNTKRPRSQHKNIG